ncbi:MAG: competence protein ComFC [Patescibacteria group bacterium]|nr:competence protein ComFC [Patescibacteria group bacterium]
MNLLNTILDIVFPVNCVSCNKNGEILCLECISLFPKAERECEEWIYPLYDYRHPPVKKLIWQLKYNKKRRLAEVLGQLMYENIVLELSDLSILENFREPLIVPIPLSYERLKERGYNQALLLCENIEKINKDLKVSKNVLTKIKETEHQANIKDRSERLKNLIGTFTVKNENLIQKRNIILIDDVTTTGATLNEAKKTLKQAGAKKIIAFTIAH